MLIPVHRLMGTKSENIDHSKADDVETPQRRWDDFPFSGDRIAQMRIASRPDCLRMVRAMVNEAGDANGCSSECISQMVMAVDEACQNIIRHAYRGDPDGVIVVDLRRQDDCISIHLLDYAAPVDVSTIKPRPLDDVKPGGLGTHFIQQRIDECSFLKPPDGTGNCLRMVKKIT